MSRGISSAASITPRQRYTERQLGKVETQAARRCSINVWAMCCAVAWSGRLVLTSRAADSRCHARLRAQQTPPCDALNQPRALCTRYGRRRVVQAHAHERTCCARLSGRHPQCRRPRRRARPQHDDLIRPARFGARRIIAHLVPKRPQLGGDAARLRFSAARVCDQDASAHARFLCEPAAPAAKPSLPSIAWKAPRRPNRRPVAQTSGVHAVEVAETPAR